MPLLEKHILVIDDTLAIRTFLRISLQAKHATLHEAATAKEGLSLFNKIKPDVVVLDLGLPDKDGLEVLREIREKSPKTNKTSVIILSVRRDQITMDKAFSLGADAYVSKPFMMDELLEIINQQMQKKKTALLG